MDHAEINKQRNLILKWSKEEISVKRDEIFELMRGLSKLHHYECFEEILNHLRLNGFHRVYMQAGCIYFEGQGDFHSSEKFLASIYHSHSDDPYVIQRYARALFALAELTKAREILTAMNRIGISAPDQIRTAKALVDLTEYDDGEKFLESNQSSNNLTLKREERILRERIKFGREHRVTNLRVNDPIFYINLETDKRKRTLFESIHGKLHSNLSRVEGLRGTKIPTPFRLAISPNRSIANEPGTVGCFISHVNAWETLAASNLEFAIIMEDDGLPFTPLNHNLITQALQSVELLFINERLSTLRTNDLILDGYSSFSSRLINLPDTQKGWGGDGYVLTKSCATRLLEMISMDLICGHLDGQLGSYATDQNLQPTNRATSTALTFRSKFKSKQQINAACLNFPMIHDVNFGLTSR